MHEVVVTKEMDRERADKIVAVGLGVSRTVARVIFDSGGATVDGLALRPSDKLSAGTVVRTEVPEVEVEMTPDPSVPFKVLYEDSYLAVLDKPIGVVVHPTSERSRGTLVHGLIAQYPSIQGVGQDGRWGIVHRLDRDTSGLLVVALGHDAYAALSEMMRERSVTRRYLALVAGLLDSTKGTIDAPVGRDPRNPTRMYVTTSGRHAITHYRRIASWAKDDVSLVSLTLETGRTHQIRVHMRAIDHPIIGDRAYGRPGSKGDPGRPWLHARQLVLEHPFKEETIDVVSALPQDLADSLEALGTPSSGNVRDIDGEAL